MIANYASKPAQLKGDSKVFVSSFAGDGLYVGAMRAAADLEAFCAPNFHPGQGSPAALDGALDWMSWDNNSSNKAPNATENATVEAGDSIFLG
jgi:hypothetical protein